MLLTKLFLPLAELCRTFSCFKERSASRRHRVIQHGGTRETRIRSALTETSAGLQRRCFVHHCDLERYLEKQTYLFPVELLIFCCSKHEANIYCRPTGQRGGVSLALYEVGTNNRFLSLTCLLCRTVKVRLAVSVTAR